MVHAGEKLSEERIKKGLTLEDVAKATKIRASFLSSIEKGEYKKLPSGAYIHGFVRNYARFLGLREHEILAIFKREYDEEKFIKVLPEGLVGKNDSVFSRFRITQTLKILPLVLVVLFSYIAFQYRSAIFNPMLSVSSPKENSVVSSQAVTVVGKTDSNSTIFINNETASVDKSGNFKKTIGVFSGRVKIIVKAINNFNRTTIIERNIEVNPVPIISR